MDLERIVGRVVMAGTYMGVALLSIGVGAMVVVGRSPLDPSVPALDLGRLPADLGAARAEGFLWLGLIVAIATPAIRVATSLVGYVVGRETGMVVVAVAILAVIALSVVVATGLGG